MWNMLFRHLSPSIPTRQFLFVTLPKIRMVPTASKKRGIAYFLTILMIIHLLQNAYCISAASNPTTVAQRQLGTFNLTWFLSIPLNIISLWVYSEMLCGCAASKWGFYPYSCLNHPVVSPCPFSPHSPCLGLLQGHYSIPQALLKLFGAIYKGCEISSFNWLEKCLPKKNVSR